MTLLAVLSDIHGNLPALEAVIADMAAFGVDQVVVAGDLINVGPFSVQVLERVTALNWSVIRGNHEFYLLDYGTAREPESRRDFALPRWLRQVIPDRWFAYIASMPDSLMLYYPDAPPIQVAHGVPGDHWKGIHPITPDEKATALLDGAKATTVIMGHTHLPMARQVQVNGHKLHLLNPGSAGLPLDGRIGLASYLLLESSADGWEPTLRRVPFDLAPVLAEFERIGFVEACGTTGRLLIEEFKTARCRLMPYLTWRKKTHPDALDSLSLVEQFLRLGDEIWDYTFEAFKVNRV